MKVYVAGKITGLKGYKQLFKAAAEELSALGYKVMNPAVFPAGFEHEEYMKICYSMIDVCDAVLFLNNWQDSKGAKMEHKYAVENSKWIKYQR